MLEKPSPSDAQDQRIRRLVLLFSIFVIGACGLLYELIAGAVASYLMGDTVVQYSLVIGTFLAAMGVGAYVTQWLRQRLLDAFLMIQIAVGVFGGFSSLMLFLAFARTTEITPLVLAAAAGCGVLVGMEIPLVLRILKDDASLRLNVAHVLTLDYLGALLASIAFPFVILPHLGLIRAGLAIGMVNVLISLLGTALFWSSLPRRRLLAACNVIALVALVTAWLGSNQATTWLEDQLYQDEIVVAETTPYQRIIVTRWRDDIRLHLDGHLQFSSADEYRYHESLVLPVLAASGQPRRVLILGGGDGLGLQLILRHPQVEHVDLVDIDSRVVSLFRDTPLLAQLNEHSLSDQRVTIHAADAMAFLRDREHGPYDVIVMDLPDPNSPRLNKLYTKSFFGLALRRLASRGAMVTQATSPFYAREAFWCIGNTIEAASEQRHQAGMGAAMRLVPYHVHVPSFGDWGFFLAMPFDQGSQLDRLSSGRFLNSETFAAAQTFPPDSSHIQTDINQLAAPVLVRYHRSGWEKWHQ